MKQKDIIIGNQYLFKSTHTEHKKDMIGETFIVISKKSGSKSYASTRGGTPGKRPVRYKLDNGRCAIASELAEIPTKSGTQ